jgi:glycosyltransferase involved in cell wall biosynthesis
MKILILSTKLPYPPRDGGAIATLNLATGLSEAGYKVVLLAMNTAKHWFNTDLIPEDLQQKITIHTVDVKARIRWPALIWNFLFSSQPYIAVRFKSLQFTYKLRQLITDERPEIIQIEGPYLYYCIPLIHKISNAKIAFRAHNIEHEIWKRRADQSKNPLARYYFRVLSHRILKVEKSMISRADITVPISELDLDKFNNIGLSRPAIVCPVGLDINRYPEPAPLSRIDLFYIGALDWGPNTEGLDWFFANVWRSITDKYPEIELHIAGRNSDFYFKSKKEISGIIINGEIDDAHAFINNHFIMIVPLFSGSGVRVKILEGMLLGRTVITTPVGAEGLDVTDNKNILIASNADEFISFIDKVIESPDLARAIGSSARQYVIENFDNLVIAKQLADFYTEQLK